MNNVKLNQGDLDSPFRVKLKGGRWWFVAIALGIMCTDIGGIHHELRRANKLHDEDLQIRRQQLDLAQRQFVLDSIMMEQNQKKR